MKYTNRIILNSLLILTGTTSLFAQSGMVSAGGNFTGSGGSNSMSVGQLDYLTTNDTGGTLTAGNQQPFEIFSMSGLEEKRISLHFRATIYPNPASDYVILKLENYPSETVTYEVYDANGKLLFNDLAQGDETEISLSAFPTATYFIHVIDNKNPVKTFKVIKTQ